MFAVHPNGGVIINTCIMNRIKNSKTMLRIPQGIQHLNSKQSKSIIGGARREGSILGKVIVGMTGALILPGG